MIIKRRLVGGPGFEKIVHTYEPNPHSSLYIWVDKHTRILAVKKYEKKNPHYDLPLEMVSVDYNRTYNNVLILSILLYNNSINEFSFHEHYSYTFKLNECH